MWFVYRGKIKELCGTRLKFQIELEFVRRVGNRGTPTALFQVEIKLLVEQRGEQTACDLLELDHIGGRRVLISSHWSDALPNFRD